MTRTWLLSPILRWLLSISCSLLMHTHLSQVVYELQCLSLSWFGNPISWCCCQHMPGVIQACQLSNTFQEQALMHLYSTLLSVAPYRPSCSHLFGILWLSHPILSMLALLGTNCKLNCSMERISDSLLIPWAVVGAAVLHRINQEIHWVYFGAFTSRR